MKTSDPALFVCSTINNWSPIIRRGTARSETTLRHSNATEKEDNKTTKPSMDGDAEVEVSVDTVKNQEVKFTSQVQSFYQETAGFLPQ